MVPLVLALEQIEVINPDDGKKKKVWVMALRSPDNMIAAAMKARMEPLQLVVSMAGEELPTPDDETPAEAKDWEGTSGDKVDPAAVKGLEGKTADEQVEELWGKDERERMSPDEAAERMTAQEIKEAEGKPAKESKSPEPKVLTFTGLLAKVKEKGKNEGWLFRSIGMTIDEAKADPEKAWKEISGLMNW